MFLAVDLVPFTGVPPEFPIMVSALSIIARFACTKPLFTSLDCVSNTVSAQRVIIGNESKSTDMFTRTTLDESQVGLPRIFAEYGTEIGERFECLDEFL